MKLVPAVSVDVFARHRIRTCIRVPGINRRQSRAAIDIVAFSSLCYDICHYVEAIMPETERHVRLFRNGRNQALRIPREFELEADEAIVRKDGHRLIIEPVRRGRLLALLAALEPLEETMPDVDEDLEPLDDVEL